MLIIVYYHTITNKIKLTHCSWEHVSYFVFVCFVFAFGKKCIAEFASFKLCLTSMWLVNIQHIKSQYYKTNLLYKHQ